MEVKRHYRPEKVKKYEARWYVEGKLKCRFFATERERDQFADNFSEQIARNGRDLLLGFDPAKMRRWQQASRLAPEADPMEVMQFWLASHRPVLRPKKLSEAISAYLNIWLASNAILSTANTSNGICRTSWKRWVTARFTPATLRRLPIMSSVCPIRR